MKYRKTKFERTSDFFAGNIRYIPDNSFIGTYYLGEEELENVIKVIRSKSLFRYDGPDVQHFTDRLEERIQEKFHVKYALACTNGAAALKLACIANGIGHGDEVIMSPFTFIATAASVLSCGGIPVFAEFDESMNLDCASIERLLTEKTKAILCVHLQGQSCDMNSILDFAKRHSLVVIEDAAQALGAKYKDDYCGCMGDCGAFSLQAGKTITCGEGGVFVTNRYDLYLKAKIYHDNGGFRQNSEYPTWINQNTIFGENFKMSELQSAVALAQFEKLDTIVRNQQAVFEQFWNYISKSDFYVWRKKPDECNNIPFSVCVIFESKEINELFMEFMQNRGVPFRRYCSNLIYDCDTFVHRQSWHESAYPYNLSKRTYQKSEKAENLIERAAWMNLSAFLEQEDISYILQAMESFKTLHIL
ncbi:MAG: DegT/DnrJ/EryC1/StrS family aminotransferase [Hungatella sp.]|jgi:8-amino-3,8-dideoxy-alpha-D-manno-octulosonate transaminase|nr:DegT/DnrJ/EryC1/StrS family aminotransferase [Hungatella sp.]